VTEDDRLDTIIRFRFGDVFPADDFTSEWVATIALAFNDIAFVHSQFDEAYEGPAYRYFYLLRLSLGHFNEAAKYLDKTEAIPEVKAFVQTLPADVQAHYADCLRRYRERKGFLAQVRNLSVFHYPELKVASAGAGKPSLMRSILDGLADETTSLFKSKTETIGDSRVLFADDIVSRLFSRGAKNEDELLEHHIEIKEAITSYMRFANGAINEWLGRAIDAGVTLTYAPGSPPSFGRLVDGADGEQR
jgi:hypothetical protein